MKKEEVYDYLAHIYLDRKGKKENKRKKPSWKYLFFVIPVISAIIAGTFLKRDKSHTERESLLVLCQEKIVRIKYNFQDSSLRASGYTLNFPDLNIAGFSQFKFKARALGKGIKSLRLELENAIREQAETYIKISDHKWEDYSINLKEFAGITKLSNIRRISFIIEDWNTSNKEDSIYIEDIRFTKERPSYALR